ncbi:extracellular solute-binding protein [Paenibacillus psychroresistens]|uniref:Extracellular solute-binding protein n=1 Tax=Paenibacillus psychroresistens TaxID=1778678 RepID=A0A6B8RSM0_9BACL|nr:extracellular solute-binding protein [Paenibacillus psychroresistens]QGQ99441.1 extracellular solute-binding protein [Paenibacillus psychroresistens]
MRKISITLLALIMVGSMLAACTKKGSNTKTEHVLRIASSYGMDEEYFRQQYTELFEFANDNIKIEIIPTQDEGNRYGYGGGYSSDEEVDPNAEKPKTPLETMMDLMDKPNPPDIVVLGFEQMKTLLDANLLAPLDQQIKKNKFDTTDIAPVVLDSLKGASEDGQLYALTSTFSSNALIYNKQMFIDAGVEEMPKDNMTWDEVFALAKKLSVGEGKDHKYGFSFSSQSQGDMFYSMKAYTDPLKLRMYDELGEKMTVDTPEWENALNTIYQLQKDKVMPSSDNMIRMKMGAGEGDQPQGPFGYDDFMSGRVAMTLMPYGQLGQIINANKSADTIKGYTKIDWDVVTVPSHPSAQGEVSNVYFNNLMAINAKSSNLEDAWKFIEFSNSEKWAQLKSHSTQQMVSRMKYILPKEGTDYHIDAFYKIKLAPLMDDTKLMQEKPNLWSVQQIGQAALQEVATGKKTVKQALTEWQTKGNMALQKLKENPNAQIDPSLFQSSPAIAVPAG